MEKNGLIIQITVAMSKAEIKLWILKYSWLQVLSSSVSTYVFETTELHAKDIK